MSRHFNCFGHFISKYLLRIRDCRALTLPSHNPSHSPKFRFKQDNLPNFSRIVGAEPSSILLFRNNVPTSGYCDSITGFWYSNGIPCSELLFLTLIASTSTHNINISAETRAALPCTPINIKIIRIASICNVCFWFMIQCFNPRDKWRSKIKEL